MNNGRTDASAAEPVEDLDLLDKPAAGGSVIRGGVLRSTGYAVGILLGVVAAPLQIRHLGGIDFGRLFTINSLIFVVTGLTELGIMNVAIREYTTSATHERLNLLSTVFGLRLALTALASAIAVGFALAAGYTDVMVTGTLLGCLGLLLGVPFGIALIPLQAELRFGWVTAIDFARQGVTTAAIVALVIGGAGLLPFFGITVAAAVTGSVMAVMVAANKISYRPSFNLARWWALLRDSVPYAVATALGILYFKVEILLMSLLSNESETGFFSVSFRIVEILTGVPWLVAGTAFPILARAAGNNPERFRSAVQRMVEVSVAIGLGIAVTLVAFADIAVFVIAGDGFSVSVNALRILGGALVGTFLFATLTFAMLALREHRTILLANLTALVIALVLSFALIPPFGAIGAAAATTATELGLAGLYLVLLSRRTPHSLDPGVSIRALVAAGPAFAILLVIAPSSPLVVVSPLLYVAGLLVTGIFPHDVLRALMKSDMDAIADDEGS
ncbi:MAG: oligosaccharide flippase family protein [Solirubrobacterales bacterium]